MKVYFAASIRGGRDDAQIYQLLIAYLKKNHQVLTEHIGNENLSKSGQAELSDQYIRERDMNWLKESDIMVAETSNPSLGVGYELASAEYLRKPVLVLHRDVSSKLSAMINGTEYFKNIYHYQTIEDAKRILNQHLEEVLKNN